MKEKTNGRKVIEEKIIMNEVKEREDINKSVYKANNNTEGK